MWFVYVLLCLFLYDPFVLRVTSQSEIDADDKNARRQFSDIIQKSKHVAVLFSEVCCQCTDCVEAEALLAAMYKDLEQQFDIIFVKLIAQEDIARSYGVTQRPSLVFLRSQRPALYDGKFEMEELTEWLSTSQEPNVRELDDTNFEHLTQASTGATTGDWLVTFFNSDCPNELALHSVLDSVALRLKGRGNVALVNTDRSPELKERFAASKCPTIILFRLGKMYFYDLPTFTPGSLKSFAEGFYRNAKTTPVPKIPSPFDKLVDHSVQYLKTHSWAPLAGVLLVLCAAIAFLSSGKKITKTE